MLATIPTRTNHRSSLPIWVTSPSSCIIRKLKSLQGKLNSEPSPALRNKVRSLEHLVASKIKEDLMLYEESIFKYSQFSTIQRYLRYKRRPDPIPTEICHENSTANTEEEKSVLFKNFFCSVFSKSNDHEDECTAESTVLTAILEDQPIEPNFSNDNITNLLPNLKPQKTCGPENLPNIMLNKCSEPLASSLTVIFRTFYNKRCFPTFCKTSELTPNFKDTDRSLEKKNRPISLLCNISKVWEKMIEKTVAEVFLPKVDPCQFSFVQKRSTLLQLLAYTDEFYRTLDSLTKFFATVYIDFAKAFDKLDHKRILEALHSTGMPNRTIDIVRSYLDNRLQRVKVGTKKSPGITSNQWSPTRINLGPLLFLVFVNSLPQVVTTSSIFMFADDTKIMSSNPMELQEDSDRFV